MSYLTEIKAPWRIMELLGKFIGFVICFLFI